MRPITTAARRRETVAGDMSAAPRSVHRRTSSRRRLALALAPLVLLSACSEKAPQDYLRPEGPIAEKIDQLWNPVFAVAVAVFIFVQGGVLFLMWRFRARHDDDEAVLPTQLHGNTKLELGWTIAPALILAFVGVFTVATLLDISDLPDDPVEITVYGQQWWWAYEYDLDDDGESDIVTAQDLIIPVGEEVVLDIRSRDVIHSFWAPKLNGKRDAVPGRSHPLRLLADKPGTYVGQCTEFCGLSHAYMHVRVVALEQADYDQWLEDQQRDAEEPTSGAAAEGAEVFRTKCSSCHLVRGVNDDLFPGEAEQVSGVAPDLTHFMTRGAFAGAIFDLWRDLDGNSIVDHDEIGQELNRAELEEWLRDPPGKKPMSPPTRGMPNLELTEDEIDKLVAFLETLE